MIRKIKREEAIEALLDEDLDISSITDRGTCLYDLLKIGCKGYSNYTNKELKQAFNERLNWHNDTIKIIGRKNQ